MSDESYSPDFNSSYDENEYRSLYSASKYYRTTTTQLNDDNQCSSQIKIMSSSRNNSHSRLDSRSPVSGSSDVECRSRSASKLSSVIMRSKETNYIEKTVPLIDMKHFQHEMSKAHVCPDGRLLFFYDTKPAVGLFHQHAFECSMCQTRTNFTNFPMKHPIRSTLQEPNARLYAASAVTGAGYEEINTIMSLLCLSITTKKHFLEQTHRIYSNLHQFAQKEFESIINYIKQSSNTNSCDPFLDICVSLDGTWKRRGHVSNYGIVFIIHVETGYCIDYEVLSLHCEVCEMNKSRLSTKAFDRWLITHKKECFKNYNGTSKGMEVEGALRIFKRSLTKGLRYKWLVCDGDSSAYTAVKNIYAEEGARTEDQHIKNQKHSRQTDLMVEKLDCINHVKKRVISRLKDIKSKNTGYQDIGSTATHRLTMENSLPSKNDQVEQAGPTLKKALSSTNDQVEQAGPTLKKALSSTNDQVKQAGPPLKKALSSTNDQVEQAGPTLKKDLSSTKDQVKQAGPTLKKALSSTNDKVKQADPTLKKGLSSTNNQVDRAGATLKKSLSLKRNQSRDSGNLLQSCRSRKILSDGKPFGGSSGRMTDAIMKKISDMYGLAIRQGISEGQKLGDNPADLVDRIQKKCLAAFYHFINLENKEHQHLYCPTDAMTWCSYQRDKITHKNEDMVKTKSRLDPVFLPLLQKMIDDLTSKELLHRCMRGLTQNSNESLNSVIWSILSKSKHHGFISIQGAAAVGSIYFNGGRKALLKFFEQSGMQVNQHLYFNFLAKDEKRTKRAERSVYRREQIISQKSTLRQKSMKAENDNSQYGRGLFY